MEIIPTLLPLITASLIAAGLLFYAWGKRPVTGSLSMIWLAIAVIIWSMGYMFELSNEALAIKKFWAKVQYLGIVAVPLAWARLCIVYSGYRHWLSRRLLIILTIVPILTLLALVVNDRLVWQTITLEPIGPILVFVPVYGPVFWLIWGYSYLLLGGGTLLLLRHVVTSFTLYRWQAVAILLSALLPWIGNFLYVLGYSLLDLTPFAFALSGLIMAVGVLRVQLFNLVPIARARVLDSMTDGVLVVDRHGKVIDANLAAVAMINRPLLQIIGYPVDELFGQYASILTHYESVESTSQELELDVEGRHLAFDIRLSPLIDNQKRSQGILVVFRDITERKGTEAALRASEERFRQLTYHSPDTIYIYNSTSQKVTFINKTSFIGYSLDELQAAQSVLSRVHPDDAMAVAAFWQSLLSEHAADVNAIDYRMQHSAGHWEWIYNRAIPLTRKEANVPNDLLVILTLITENKQTEIIMKEREARLRVLVEQTPIGIITIDLSGAVTDANLRGISLLAATDKDAIIGVNLLTMPSLVKAEISPMLGRVLATGKMEELEMWYPSPSDSSQFLLVRAVPHIDGNNNKSGLIVLVEDLTQRQQAEEGMRRAQKLESLGVMASGIAHDFNNLLVPLLGQSSLALVKLPGENEARKHIEKAVQAAQRAAVLVRQLLTYSGKSQGQIRPLQLNSIIEENAHLFSVGIPKTVILETELMPDLPLLKADAGQIQQIVMNLIINAAEAIGQHPGKVSVKTETCQMSGQEIQQWQGAAAQAKPGPYILLQVADTGHGMDKMTLAKMFDPFYTTKATGRGLGLAAVLGIVRACGGGLHVTSEMNIGTTFRLYFPIGTARTQEINNYSREINYPHLIGCILIVEQEEPVRTTAFDILNTLGLDVHIASDGEQGVNIFQQYHNEVDLVLLDYSMQGMGVQQTVNQLRLRNPDVQVLITSGLDESEINTELEMMGLTGFLKKPFDVHALVTAVASFLK